MSVPAGAYLYLLPAQRFGWSPQSELLQALEAGSPMLRDQFVCPGDVQKVPVSVLVKDCPGSSRDRPDTI